MVLGSGHDVHDFHLATIAMLYNNTLDLTSLQFIIV
jgi:hypothetical protein